MPRIEISVEREAASLASRVVTLDAETGRVGSHESNDLVLADARVSRFHCTLRRDATGWRLSDADSTNGTWLGGVRVWEAAARRARGRSTSA